MQHWFQGPSSGEQASATTGSAASGAGPTESASASVSSDKNRNYAVLAGTVAALSGLGWYLLSKPKKSEEVVDWRGGLWMRSADGIFHHGLLSAHRPAPSGNNCWNVLCTTCSEACCITETLKYALETFSILSLAWQVAMLSDTCNAAYIVAGEVFGY